LKSYADLNTEFRNEQGIKLSSDINLKDANSIILSPSANTSFINTALESSVFIVKSQASNADFDWVCHILKKTAYKLKTNEEKLLMTKTIVEICEISPDISVSVLGSIINIFCVNDIDRAAILKEMSNSSSEKVAELIAVLKS
jgi:hypothetical protein